jgi:hypothetical protein
VQKYQLLRAQAQSPGDGLRPLPPTERDRDRPVGEAGPEPLFEEHRSVGAAVAAGDDLEEVAVGILEVHASTTVVVIDRALGGAAGVGPVIEALIDDAAEDFVELGSRSSA